MVGKVGVVVRHLQRWKVNEMESQRLGLEGNVRQMGVRCAE